MLKHLKTLDSLNHDSMFVHKNLGLVYLQLNDLEKASKHLDTAIDINRYEPILYYYKALVNENQGHLKTAKDYLKNAIYFLKPEWGKEYYELGMIAKKQKLYKTALSYFNKATQYSPYPDTDFQKAILYEAVFKDDKKALKYYEKYVNALKNRNKEKTKLAQAAIKKLKLKIFMKKN
jgi:tetratricopeptide (TPR) repeat protein